ncbi:MAG: ribonucrease, partial [Pseudonocardiales bacterium]|nr:ribonucrease [Pseudonocardiales bacterium]
MNGVWYAAVGAIFVLGLLFVLAYARRTAPAGRHQVAAPDPDEVQVEARRLAQTEASALRQAVQAETEGLRRVAEAEAEATRRSARADAESTRAQAEAMLAAARERAAAAAAQAREAASAEVTRLTEDARRLQSAQEARSARLDEAEERLDTRQNRLEQRADELRAQGEELAALRDELDSRLRRLEADQQALAAQADDHRRALEQIAGLTTEQAKAPLLAGVETTARREAAVLARAIENEARAEGTERARAIVVEAVQRVASAQTTETVVSVLHLPAEEMKGRIIGREGRNIRAFEAVTGVNVLIDDTPEAVLLSCFDPVRREVGRLTLEKLILDGRIHPHRIEEAHEQSLAEVAELCERAARDALADVGIGAVDERLIPTIGRLKYRTSYGQNVLGHLVETAHIAGVMAAELGIEPTLVKRCAFLHDIGKALTHEVEGSHAIIGAELLRKYGEDEAV